MAQVSGSTKRPVASVIHPDPPGPQPHPSAEPSADPRARSAQSVQSERSDPSAARASSSTTGAFTPGTLWSRLIDSLVGDVLLRHVPGCRVLDLGHGSPEVSEWVAARVGSQLAIVDKARLEHDPDRIAERSGFLPASEFLDADGELIIPDDGDEALCLPEYRDASFDVVYCLRTFPHLGFDTESSERLGRELLLEAARVTADGGTVFVQIANSRSLRGLIEGIRNPITVVSRRRMILGDRYGLTRWDTLPRFLQFLPPELEFVRTHGLGVAIPHDATLQIPLAGRVLQRLEWPLRDMAVARRFGAQLLIELRRLHRSDPTLRGGPQRTTLSSSLIEALSSSTRSLTRGRIREIEGEPSATTKAPARDRDE
jgi:SAM-dependent methyltransferase